MNSSFVASQGRDNKSWRDCDVYLVLIAEGRVLQRGLVKAQQYLE